MNGFPWVVNQVITIVLVSIVAVQIVQTGRIGRLDERWDVRARYKSAPVCFLTGGMGLKWRTDGDSDIYSACSGRLATEEFSSDLNFPVTLTFLNTENKLRID
jgi:hypothetical protein